MSDLIEFNGQILRELRRQTHLSLEQISKSIAIPVEQLDAFENNVDVPNTKTLRSLAKYFSIDEFNFYRKTTPRLTKFASFRTAESIGVEDFQAVSEALTVAKSFSKLLNSASQEVSSWKLNLNKFKAAIQKGAEGGGEAVRALMGVEDEVQLSKISADQFFTYVRHAVENNGISVVVQSFNEHRMKGIAFGAETNVPLILINSFKQTKPSRSFTLAHELCHVIRGEDGVSNPYASENQVEKFCNKFAAAFLMPRQLVDTALSNGRRISLDIGGSGIKSLSNKLKTSQESVVIRLEELGYVARGSWAKWKRLVAVKGCLPSELTKKGGSGAADQGVTKLAYYGFLFGELIPDRIKQKKMSETAVFKATRLRPKFIGELQRASQEKKLEVRAYGTTQ